MESTPDRNRLLQLRSIVKGHPAVVGSVKKGLRRLWVFYLPYYVPITTITEQLVRDGAKVTKTVQEKDRETELMTNIWNLSIEVDNPDQVQDRMRWSFEGMTGSILINMNGRPPKCLRCVERGHHKFECTAPYCYKCRKVGHAESDDCPTQSCAARSVYITDKLTNPQCIYLYTDY